MLSLPIWSLVLCFEMTFSMRAYALPPGLPQVNPTYVFLEKDREFERDLPAAAYGRLTDVHLKVAYRNFNIPQGSKVFLISALAWTYHHQSADWLEEEEVEMSPGRGDHELGTWNSEINRDMRVFKAIPGRQDILKYYFKVVHADGQTEYDNGGSTLGYYLIDLPESESAIPSTASVDYTLPNLSHPNGTCTWKLDPGVIPTSSFMR